MPAAYKLDKKQALALDLAHNNLTNGVLSEHFNIYFVNKLPWQPFGKYRAKIWGENNIYILNSSYRDLAHLLSTYDGRKLLSHESVHQAQLLQLGGWSGFVWAYIKGHISGGFDYKKNPLEVEAYAKEAAICTKFEKGLKFV